jgi:hypothetical protein
MNRFYRNLIFIVIMAVVIAFIPNKQISAQKDTVNTVKVKPVAVKDSTELKYDEIFKQQQEVNKSLDDILLERKQQQKKMDNNKNLK